MSEDKKKKDVVILFRLKNEEEKQEIQDYARNQGFTTSGLIKHIIFEKIRGIDSIQAQQSNTVDNKLLNRILEKLDLLNGNTKDLKLRNQLLEKMVSIQQRIQKEIPQKTIEEKKEVVLKVLNIYKNGLNYRVNKTPMKTTKIVGKSRLKAAEVITILESLKQDNLIEKYKNGWDLVDDE